MNNAVMTEWKENLIVGVYTPQFEGFMFESVLAHFTKHENGVTRVCHDYGCGQSMSEEEAIMLSEDNDNGVDIVIGHQFLSLGTLLNVLQEEFKLASFNTIKKIIEIPEVIDTLEAIADTVKIDIKVGNLFLHWLTLSGHEVKVECFYYNHEWLIRGISYGTDSSKYFYKGIKDIVKSLQYKTVI